MKTTAKVLPFPDKGGATAACALARRGFRVFALKPGKKWPLRTGWQESATADANDALDRWHVGSSPGIATGDGLIVIDADVKHGGLEAVAKLGLPQTFTVRTASGGRHLYFKVPPGRRFATRACGVRKDGTKVYAIPGVWGVDVRGEGGLVVGPGGEFNGKPYSIEDDRDLADAPAAFMDLLNAAPEKSDGAGKIAEGAVLDTSWAIARAEKHLRSEADLAIEGSGGDCATIVVANRLFDFGLSEDTALQLMLTHWNGRCLPPWDDDELAYKVGSALRSRQDAVGRDQVTRHFEEVPPLPPGTEPAPVDDGFYFPDLTRDPATIPPRPWVFKPDAMRDQVAVIIAAPGVGKSAFSLGMTVAGVRGDADFLGMKVIGGPKRVLIINNEDDSDEQERRIAAFCKLHGFDQKALNGWIALYEMADGTQFVAVTRDGKNGLKRTEALAKLRAFIIKHKIDLVIIDPFRSVHHGSENDSGDVDFVAGALLEVMRETHCAGVIVHHSRKPSGASTEGTAGDPDSGRGSNALIGKARKTLTLTRASKTDANEWGIPEADRRRFVRLDDAKPSYSAMGNEPRWYELLGVPVGGDETAVAVRLAELKRVEAAPKEDNQPRKTLLAAFARVAFDSSLANPEIPGGRAATVEAVRDEFNKAYPTGAWEPKKLAANLRQVWKRAKDGLPPTIRIVDIGGVDCIYDCRPKNSQENNRESEETDDAEEA